MPNLPRTRTTSIALCVGALLYFVIQWTFASKIGPNRIFSATRVADQAGFRFMIDNLSKAIHATCHQDGLDTFLFEDGDTALPYLQLENDRMDGCSVIRETNVTPFTRDVLDGCNIVYIREYEFSDQHRDPEAALQLESASPARFWIPLDRWISSDKRFAFALYRHPCTTPKATS